MSNTVPRGPHLYPNSSHFSLLPLPSSNCSFSLECCATHPCRNNKLSPFLRISQPVDYYKWVAVSVDSIRGSSEHGPLTRDSSLRWLRWRPRGGMNEVDFRCCFSKIRSEIIELTSARIDFLPEVFTPPYLGGVSFLALIYQEN